MSDDDYIRQIQAREQFEMEQRARLDAQRIAAEQAALAVTQRIHAVQYDLPSSAGYYEDRREIRADEEARRRDDDERDRQQRERDETERRIREEEYTRQLSTQWADDLLRQGEVQDALLRREELRNQETSAQIFQDAARQAEQQAIQAYEQQAQDWLAEQRRDEEATARQRIEEETARALQDDLNQKTADLEREQQEWLRTEDETRQQAAREAADRYAAELQRLMDEPISAPDTTPDDAEAREREERARRDADELQATLRRAEELQAERDREWVTAQLAWVREDAATTDAGEQATSAQRDSERQEDDRRRVEDELDRLRQESERQYEDWQRHDRERDRQLNEELARQREESERLAREQLQSANESRRLQYALEAAARQLEVLREGEARTTEVDQRLRSELQHRAQEQEGAARRQLQQEQRRIEEDLTRVRGERERMENELDRLHRDQQHARQEQDRLRQELEQRAQETERAHLERLRLEAERERLRLARSDEILHGAARVAAARTESEREAQLRDYREQLERAVAERSAELIKAQQESLRAGLMERMSHEYASDWADMTFAEADRAQALRLLDGHARQSTLRETLEARWTEERESRLDHLDRKLSSKYDDLLQKQMATGQAVIGQTVGVFTDTARGAIGQFFGHLASPDPVGALTSNVYDQIDQIRADAKKDQGDPPADPQQDFHEPQGAPPTSAYKPDDYSYLKLVGIPDEQAVVLGRVCGQRFDMGEPRRIFGALWESIVAEQDAKQALENARLEAADDKAYREEARKIFGKVRDELWNRIESVIEGRPVELPDGASEDSIREFFSGTGLVFERKGSRANAPRLYLVDGKVTLKTKKGKQYDVINFDIDHQIQLSQDPDRAISSSNLRLTFRRENQVALTRYYKTLDLLDRAARKLGR